MHHFAQFNSLLYELIFSKDDFAQVFAYLSTRESWQKNPNFTLENFLLAKLLTS